MSKEEIKAWAALLGVKPSDVRREVRRVNDLARARKDPSNWVVLKSPNGEIDAFPKYMFPAAA